MTEEIWFTSDTHFGHEKILTIGHGRPFASIDEHDHELIRRWNSVVQAGDRVYHLGDLSFNRDGRTIEILRQLAGQIHLVKGNHDSSKRLKKYLDLGLLVTLNDYKKLTVEDKTAGESGKRVIVLSHYPFLTWEGAHRGAWMLHGHCHGNLRASKNTRLDVGVDCWSYTPVSYSELVLAMRNRKYEPVDHHE